MGHEPGLHRQEEEVGVEEQRMELTLHVTAHRSG